MTPRWKSIEMGSHAVARGFEPCNIAGPKTCMLRARRLGDQSTMLASQRSERIVKTFYLRLHTSCQRTVSSYFGRGGRESSRLPVLCGARGIRTPDILLAKQALYQLSYGPDKRAHRKPLSGSGAGRS